MNLRLLVALSMGAIVTGVYAAGEDTKSLTALPLTAKQLLEEADILGRARLAFDRDCISLDQNSWFTNQSDIEHCNALIAKMHRSYRKLSPKSVIKDDELLSLHKPFELNGFTNGAYEKARELYQKKYGLKKDAFYIYLDKNGELKQYSILGKPRNSIDYVPNQTKQ